MLAVWGTQVTGSDPDTWVPVPSTNSSIWQSTVNMFGMQQLVTDEAIDQWHKQLKSRVKANARHFEHLL